MTPPTHLHTIISCRCIASAETHTHTHTHKGFVGGLHTRSHKRVCVYEPSFIEQRIRCFIPYTVWQIRSYNIGRFHSTCHSRYSQHLYGTWSRLLRISPFRHHDRGIFFFPMSLLLLLPRELPKKSGQTFPCIFRLSSTQGREYS